MANKNRYTKERVAKALIEAKGFVSAAAKNLKCSDVTVRSYINRYQDCRDAVNSAREEMLDVAEGRLLQNINAGDTTAIIFFLKTQGRIRGYSERHIIDANLGQKTQEIIKAVLRPSDDNENS